MAALRAAARRLLRSSSAAAPHLLGHFHNPVARDLPCSTESPPAPSSSRWTPPPRASPSTSSPAPPPDSASLTPTSASCSSSGAPRPAPTSSSATPSPAATRCFPRRPRPPSGTASSPPPHCSPAPALSTSTPSASPSTRTWVASFRRGGECRWCPLPRSRSVCIDWPPTWVECRCVRAAGSLYWGICNNDSALALDPATMEFSSLRAPALIWEDIGLTRYRIGEMRGDGRLCVAAMEADMLRICVRGEGSDDGWVLERDVSLSEVFNSVTDNPTFCPWLGGIDAGRTGRVFIRSFGHGHFSYHLDTGKLERLLTDDGKDFGHPIFAYFAAPDGGSD